METVTHWGYRLQAHALVADAMAWRTSPAGIYIQETHVLKNAQDTDSRAVLN